MVAIVEKEEHFDSNKLAASGSDTELETTTEVINEGSEQQGQGRIQYKPVVIIGNGPSGIILSYFLAGNWPNYNGLGESINEMLHYRLLSDGVDKKGESASLVEQDLDFLSQGLEGRTSNPVALLFDCLNHPQADLGLELPSLLNWSYRPEKEIDHVVIGKGPPGGAWQSMDGNVLTISLGCWMELPGLNFREWEAGQEERCCRESRASVASVAQYYCDYVKTQGLEKYFLPNSSVVTEVRRVPQKLLSFICDNSSVNDVDEDEGRSHRRHTVSGVPTNGSTNANNNDSIRNRNRNRSLWKVKGYTRTVVGPESRIVLRPFSYLTPNVVLATGASDKPNSLNVPGEDLPFVLHSLNDLEHIINSGKLTRDSDPVLVVGAGLCAADAIIAARFHSVPVIHVFRRSVNDPALIFRQLPENMYPEYHKVYQMMRDPLGYDNYKACQEHVITRILPNRRVNLSGPISCGTVKVSYIAVCIGSHPDLSFLPADMRLECNLGVIPGLPVDCKRNPVAIDAASHECIREPGLYALGPVAGENFVRFLQGGALAITNHLVKEQPHLLKK